MYKRYEKNGYDVMQYDFNSVASYIDYLDNTPTGKTFSGESLSSQKLDSEFSKTKTLQEAKDLCKYGCHEDFDKIMKLKMSLDKYINKVNSRPKQFNYYVGYAPDVKAYLEGNPLSMLDKESKEQDSICIYYNIAVNSGISTNQIFNRGAITLSIIEILESMGFKVELHIVDVSKKYDEIMYTNFNFKKADERVNPLKLFFPLCHPAFLRRLWFRLLETNSDISSSWRDGYGQTVGENFVINTLLIH